MSFNLIIDLFYPCMQFSQIRGVIIERKSTVRKDVHTNKLSNSSFINSCFQSHYREVARWEISMKNIWELGWFWAGSQYWKKFWGRLRATFEGVFFMFHGQKEKNIICKGQIILEQKCGVLNFPKMQQNYC